MLPNQGDLTFSKFGKSFQESLVQLIVEQRIFADQIEEVLDIEFLEFKYLRSLVRKIFEYKQKYKTHPSYPNLVTIFKTEFDDESEILKKQIKDYMAYVEFINAKLIIIVPLLLEKRCKNFGSIFI